MASFFQKVDWTECTGEMDPQCPRFMNKERLPAYKGKCTDCGSKTREITRTDPLKMAIVAAVALLVLGSAGFVARASVLKVFSSMIPGTKIEKDPNSEDKPLAKAGEIIWTVEVDKSGDRVRLTSRDFNAQGNVFQSRDQLNAGDRIRFDVTYTANWLYAYYRGEGEATRLGAHSGGRATLPSTDGWFRMDNRAGTEEFILIAAADSVPTLDPLTGTFDPAALDSVIKKLETGDKTTVIRVRVPHL